MDIVLQLLGCEFKAIDDIFDIFGAKSIKKGGTFIILGIGQDAIAHVVRTSAKNNEANIRLGDYAAHVYCCDIEGCKPTGRCLSDDNKTMEYLHAWTEPFPHIENDFVD